KRIGARAVMRLRYVRTKKGIDMKEKKYNLVINGVNVGELRPMSAADRWGYNDGSMPEIVVIDANGRIHQVRYHKWNKLWMSIKNDGIYFRDWELLGWLPAPTLAIKEE